LFQHALCHDAGIAGGVLPLNLALANHTLVTIDDVVLMLGFDEGKSQVNHITNGT
jgi:hypothetical protein